MGDTGHRPRMASKVTDVVMNNDLDVAEAVDAILGLVSDEVPLGGGQMDVDVLAAHGEKEQALISGVVGDLDGLLDDIRGEMREIVRQDDLFDEQKEKENSTSKDDGSSRSHASATNIGAMLDGAVTAAATVARDVRELVHQAQAHEERVRQVTDDIQRLDAVRRNLDVGVDVLGAYGDLTRSAAAAHTLVYERNWPQLAALLATLQRVLGVLAPLQDVNELVAAPVQYASELVATLGADVLEALRCVNFNLVTAQLGDPVDPEWPWGYVKDADVRAFGSVVAGYDYVSPFGDRYTPRPDQLRAWYRKWADGAALSVASAARRPASWWEEDLGATGGDGASGQDARDGAAGGELWATGSQDDHTAGSGAAHDGLLFRRIPHRVAEEDAQKTHLQHRVRALRKSQQRAAQKGAGGEALGTLPPIEVPPESVLLTFGKSSMVRGATELSQVLAMVAALGGKYAREAIGIICKSLLAEFVYLFGEGGEGYTIEQAGRMFFWYKGKVRGLESRNFADIIPRSLTASFMAHFAFEFASAVSHNIAGQLQTVEVEDVPNIVKLLESSLAFERSMRQEFAQAGSRAQRQSALHDDRDASPEAIRRKWKRKLAERDRLKQLKEEQGKIALGDGDGSAVGDVYIPEAAPFEGADLFKGLISSAIEPSLWLYVGVEQKAIDQGARQLMVEEDGLPAEVLEQLRSSYDDATLTSHDVKCSIEEAAAQKDEGQGAVVGINMPSAFLNGIETLLARKLQVDAADRAIGRRAKKVWCVLTSATQLFVSFQAPLQRCYALTRKQSLFSLFLSVCNTLEEYRVFLRERLPALRHGGGDSGGGGGGSGGGHQEAIRGGVARITAGVSKGIMKLAHAIDKGGNTTGGQGKKRDDHHGASRRDMGSAHSGCGGFGGQQVFDLKQFETTRVSSERISVWSVLEMAYVMNAAEYCVEAVESLKESVAQLIDPSFRDHVLDSEHTGSFEAVAAQASECMLAMITSLSLDRPMFLLQKALSGTAVSSNKSGATAPYAASGSSTGDGSTEWLATFMMGASCALTSVRGMLDPLEFRHLCDRLLHCTFERMMLSLLCMGDHVAEKQTREVERLRSAWDDVMKGEAVTRWTDVSGLGIASGEDVDASASSTPRGLPNGFVIRSGAVRKEVVLQVLASFKTWRGFCEYLPCVVGNGTVWGVPEDCIIQDVVKKESSRHSHGGSDSRVRAAKPHGNPPAVLSSDLLLWSEGIVAVANEYQPSTLFLQQAYMLFSRLRTIIQVLEGDVCDVVSRYYQLMIVNDVSGGMGSGDDGSHGSGSGNRHVPLELCWILYAKGVRATLSASVPSDDDDDSAWVHARNAAATAAAKLTSSSGLVSRAGGDTDDGTGSREARSAMGDTDTTGDGAVGLDLPAAYDGGPHTGDADGNETTMMASASELSQYDGESRRSSMGGVGAPATMGRVQLSGGAEGEHEGALTDTSAGGSAVGGGSSADGRGREDGAGGQHDDGDSRGTGSSWMKGLSTVKGRWKAKVWK